MGDIKTFMQPNITLFQHVPVICIVSDGDGKSKDEDHSHSKTETRYRISSHEEAAIFFCRFKPSMEETLSVHNLNYDYQTIRKA
jgi:hypothetical protein